MHKVSPILLKLKKFISQKNLLQKGKIKMKKNIKTLLCLIISILFVLNSILLVTAKQFNSGNIRGLTINTDLSDYAHTNYKKHVHALIQSGDLTGTIQDYNITAGFTLFNVEENTSSVCFPIVKDGTIKAIFEVSTFENEYSASLSASFSKELENITRSINKDIVFLTDGQIIQIYDGNKISTIYDSKITKRDIFTINLSNNFSYNIYSLNNNISLNNIKNSFAKKQNNIIPLGTDKPRSYRTLPVNGVIQTGNTCWAATCAAIINYFRGTNLTAYTVANYIYGSNWNQGATWTQIHNAYLHWNVNATQTGVISFSQIKNNINSNKPMHLGLIYSNFGHSVALIGYEDWTGVAGSLSDKIIILLEPNDGRHKTVILNSSGNFSYSLGGGSYTWQLTREF